MKKITLVFSACLLLFVSCNNKEKEIVIQCSTNPQYDLGALLEDVDDLPIKQIKNVYSLFPGDNGKILHDTIVAKWLKPVRLKLFVISKEGEVLNKIAERNYRKGIPYIKVFDKEINLNPYLCGISCECMRNYYPNSYNDLILYKLNVIGKSEIDNKYYSLPITLMINIKTKETTIIGRSYYTTKENTIAIYDDEFFCVLDYYMDSREYIYKYYDLYGYYVGWTPSVGLEYTATHKKFYYTTPMETTNWDWTFTYGDDKYGRPVSMEKSKEKYDIKYTKTGYHIAGYDDKGRKTADYEQNNENDFIDLRTWDLKFNRWGRLTRYSYDSKGALDTRIYYNNSQSYYLKESRRYDGTFHCVGIYANSGKNVDDILIDVDDYWGESIIYRNDHKTGRRNRMATLSSNKIKSWLLDYLYELD